MNPEEVARQIREFLNELNRTRESDLFLVAKELRSLIVLRVQNKGERADGSSFGGYSQAVVPYVFYFNKLSANKLKKLKKKGYFVSYEDVRDAANLQSDYKDFTFTGEMFRNTQATVTKVSVFSTGVTIAGITQSSADKLGWNTERDGLILEASDQEEDMVIQSRQSRIDDLINRFF